MVLKKDRSNIDLLVKELKDKNTIDFKHGTLYYHIHATNEENYNIDVYNNPEKDEDGDYLVSNIIDGGVCIGNAKDAIEFMLDTELHISKEEK